MDNSSLAALISLYIFPTGRRQFALGQVVTRAKLRDFPELAKHCSGAITHDRGCLILERRWDGVVAESRGKVAPSPPAAGAPPNTADVDPLVDKTLTAIRDHAVSQTAGAAPDDPIHAMVAAFLKEIYPAGVAEVTKLGFVEELAAVDVIVGLLQSKELGPVVKDLGLGRLVKRLADLAVVYRASQLAQPEEALAFSNVRVARIKGQDLLLEAIAIVIGKHHSSSAEDVAARSDLLGPILEQNDAIGAALKGRRSVVDVNPDTGAADPSVPAPAKAPAAPAAPAAPVAVGTGAKTP